MSITATETAVNYVDLLCKFVDSRPGLDFNDYGDVRAYRKEMREITNDRADFYEFLRLAHRFADSHQHLSELIREHLEKSSDRLTLTPSGKLQYITGQYFPTEYRPAASRVLRAIIWGLLANEKRADGSHIYETGHDIRKVFKISGLARRTYRNYFG